MNKNLDPKMPSLTITRRYDLDWLRVLAMSTVFFFHSLRFFTLEDWHIKNPTTYLVIENLANYLECWMMPLIFIVSGASMFFEMQKNKPARKFIQDKALRLLVPLVVGIFTHSILQVYLERLSHGDFNGSFWAFLPNYCNGLYGFGGNFAWMGMHLWYLEVLFIFSILFLPFILLLRREPGMRLVTKFGDLLAAPGAVYILALAAILSWKLLDPESLLGKEIFGWPLGMYLSFYLAGYLFVSNEHLVESIRRQRWFSFAGALASTMLFLTTQDHADIVVWFMILTFLGFACQYLRFSSPFLGYANRAVLPFYILHQPMLVCVGFFVVQWQIPDLLKYLAIAIPAFILTLGLYEFLVRRFNPLRLLFGMKVLQRSTRSAESITLGYPNFYSTGDE
jgi:peptidoglycan/LPS O-acetylase OafA/YrhL